VISSTESVARLFNPKGFIFAIGSSVMQNLGRTVNALGAEILLEDTDRLRYSEIRTLLEEEADFLQLARSAQLADLRETPESVNAESGTFWASIGVRALQQDK
jgi:hypothetical protein